MAALLRVPAPVSYQLSGAARPEQSSLALLAGLRVPLLQARPGQVTCLQGSAGPRDHRPPPPPALTRPQGCSHCRGVLGNRVHVVKELKQVRRRRVEVRRRR